MTAGIKALRKIQMGRETTAGTIVAATTLWRGMGAIEDPTEVIFPEEDIGYLSGVDRSYIPKVAAAISFDSVEATFEQLPHVFEAGVKSVGTGVTDTGGSGKVYTYPMPTTAANTIKTYTLEGGDNAGAEVMQYSFVKDFTLEGAAGEAVMVAANWVGRQVAPQAFTGSVALPAVEDILFSKGKLYIDAVGGSFGGTQVSNQFLEMSLKVTTGWKEIFTGDGNLYFSFVKATKPEVLLDITFEHDTNAIAEKVNWRAQTPRKVRLLFEGTALTTAGTFTYKSLIIDMAGKWETFSILNDDDGDDTVTGTFRSNYDATAAAFAQFKIVNQLATIP